MNKNATTQSSSTTTSPQALHAPQVTLSKAALDLSSGDVLLGESGGTTTVHDARHNSLLAGFVSIETEHGFLLLDDDRAVTFEVLDETETLHVAAARPETTPKPSLDLTDGDVLIGENDGTSLVYDSRPGSLLSGFVTVETEHGFLLLDDDRDVTFEVASNE